MATYTIGYYSSSTSASERGQTFTPNVPGGGTGIPEGITTFYLVSATFAYSTSSTTGRANAVYLYTSKPTLTDLNNSGANSLAASSSTSDGSAFGDGTYTRTFTFDPPIQLDLATKYFLLFALNQTFRYATGSPYSGGEALNPLLSNTSFDAQFEVVVTDTV